MQPNTIKPHLSRAVRLSALATALITSMNVIAAAPSCQARTGETAARVIELYTSEGCSSCPPADRWLSSLKKDNTFDTAVIQAFHVSYWDDLGWVDRFAKPEFTLRQRQVAAWQRSSTVYTPQIVENGRDAPLRRIFGLGGGNSGGNGSATDSSGLSVTLTGDDKNGVTAEVAAANPKLRWAAYWTVTEDGHTSIVRAGENRGETLRHDFVVRQYLPVTTRQGNAKLAFDAGAPDAKFARRINFVIYAPDTGKPLQALRLSC